jgi:hypothetical protein
LETIILETEHYNVIRKALMDCVLNTEGEFAVQCESVYNEINNKLARLHMVSVNPVIKIS